MNDAHPLANPVLSSLLGPHAHLAQRRGQALRYPADVATFVGLPEPADESVWRDVAALVGPGGVMAVAGITATPPPEWTVPGGPRPFGVLIALSGHSQRR